MPSLVRNSARFESDLLIEDSNIFIRGVLFPMSEGDLPSYDFATPRMLLRVDKDCPLATGDMIVDPAGRRLICADHDTGFLHDQILYRTHRLFVATGQYSWQRSANVIDPVTGLAKGISKDELGPIWGAMEFYGREQADRVTHIADEMLRFITSAPIELNDIVDGRVVKRLDFAFGIRVAEIQ